MQIRRFTQQNREAHSDFLLHTLVNYSLNTAAAIAFVFSLTIPATAVPRTWNGSVNGDMSNNGNWAGANTGANDDAIFYSVGAGNLSSASLDINTGSAEIKQWRSLAFNTNATSPVTISILNNTIATNDLMLLGGQNANGRTIEVLAGHHTIVGDGGTSPQDDDLRFNSSTQTRVFYIADGASLNINARLGDTNSSASNLDYIKTGEGVLMLSANSGGTSSWNLSNFQVNEGILRLGNNAATGLSTNDYSVADGATLELTANYGSNNGVLTLNGAGHGAIGALHNLTGDNLINVANGANMATAQLLLATTSTINISAGSLTIHQDVNGAGGLTKIGTGDLILTNLTEGNAYSGITNIDEGRLLVNGKLSAGGGTVNINSGGTLGGVGPVERHVNLNDGGVHAVGNSIGAQMVNSETWNGGGIVEVEFNDFSGTAGVNWDLLEVAGILEINATDTDLDRVVIKLISLDPANDNFDAGADIPGRLIGDTAGLMGFDPSFFTFDTSMFGHDLEGGAFSVSSDNSGGLYLSFTSAFMEVPEPHSLAMWALIGLVLTGWHRQRLSRRF